MEISEIKTIILGKIEGKSESQIQLDLLQNEVAKDKDIISSFETGDIKTKIKEAIDQLISEGKLLVDAAGVILDR